MILRRQGFEGSESAQKAKDSEMLLLTAVLRPRKRHVHHQSMP